MRVCGCMCMHDPLYTDVMSGNKVCVCVGVCVCMILCIQMSCQVIRCARVWVYVYA